MLNGKENYTRDRSRKAIAGILWDSGRLQLTGTTEVCSINYSHLF